MTSTFPENASDQHVPIGNTSRTNQLGWATTLLIALAFVGVGLSSLDRLPFFDGVEHINLASVQETCRDVFGLTRQLPGSTDDPPIVGAHPWGERVNDRGWMIPTLEGQPRLVKPPLTAWITAAGVQQSTIRDLSSPDPAIRQAAMKRFLFESRWTAIVCAGLMLLAIYDLGRTCGGFAGLPVGWSWRVGLLSVIVCASTLLFLRQGRRATTDLQLALWITVANAFLARMVLQKQIWLGAIGGGIAIGLASMSKGPHIALLQSAVPAVVFALLARHAAPNHSPSPLHPGEKAGMRGNSDAQPRLFKPLLVGVLLMLAVGLWWYVWILATVPGVTGIWLHEGTRIGANKAGMAADKWHQYTTFLPLLRPWTAWFVFGLLIALRDELAFRSSRSKRPGGAMFCLLLVLVPILVMSFFSERKERYLIPMAGGASVLAAIAIARFFAAEETIPKATSFRIRALLHDDRKLGWLAASITVLLVGWLAIGVPIAGAMNLKSYQTPDGQPWFTWTFAIVIAATGLLILLAGGVISRDWKPAGIVATLLAAWLAFEAWSIGYTADDDVDSYPQKALARAIWRDYPDAIVHTTRSPTEYGRLSLPTFILSLELNRRAYPIPKDLPTKPDHLPHVLLTDVTAPTDPVPAVPLGWKRLEVVPLRKGVRYVDVLEKRAK